MSRRGDEAAGEIFWITLDFDAGDSTSTHLLITDDLLFGENELKVEETFDDASDTFLDLSLAESLKLKLTLSFSLCFLTLGVEFSDVSSWSHSFLFLIFSFNHSPCNF